MGASLTLRLKMQAHSERYQALLPNLLRFRLSKADQRASVQPMQNRTRKHGPFAARRLYERAVRSDRHEIRGLFDGSVLATHFSVSQLRQLFSGPRSVSLYDFRRAGCRISFLRLGVIVTRAVSFRPKFNYCGTGITIPFHDLTLNAKNSQPPGKYS